MFLDLFDVYINDTKSCGCLAAEKRTVIPLEDMDGHNTQVVLKGDETIELSCSCLSLSVDSYAKRPFGQWLENYVVVMVELLKCDFIQNVGGGTCVYVPLDLNVIHSDLHCMLGPLMYVCQSCTGAPHHCCLLHHCLPA